MWSKLQRSAKTVKVKSLTLFYVRSSHVEEMTSHVLRYGYFAPTSNEDIPVDISDSEVRSSDLQLKCDPTIILTPILVCHSTCGAPVLNAMKRQVHHDSPTTPRAISISGKICSVIWWQLLPIYKSTVSGDFMWPSVWKNKQTFDLWHQSGYWITGGHRIWQLL